MNSRALFLATSVLLLSSTYQISNAMSLRDETKQMIDQFSKEKNAEKKFKLAQSLCLTSTKVDEMAAGDAALKKSLQDLVTERKAEVQESCDRTEALRKFIDSLDEKAVSKVTDGKLSVRSMLTPKFPYGWEIVKALNCPDSEVARMKKEVSESFVRDQAFDVSVLANLYEDANQKKYLSNLEQLASKNVSDKTQKEYVVAATRALKKESLADPTAAKTMKEEIKGAEGRLERKGVPKKQIQKFVMETAQRFPGCLAFMNPQLQTPGQ